MECKGPFYDESSELYYHLRRCWKCFLFEEEGVTNAAEARAFILVNSGAHKKRKQRRDNFKDAFQHTAEEFPGVTPRSEIVKLARDLMLKLFEGFWGIYCHEGETLAQ